MGMSASGDKNYNSEINVTPMVDIMLVLMIIFMVVTPLLQTGVSVTLPQNMRNPEEDPNIVKESSIVVAITKDDKYFLGKKELGNKEDLKTELQDLLKNITEEEKRVVYIKGDGEASYGNVVDIVNMIRQARVERIGLVADRRRGGDVGGVTPPTPPAPATQ